MVQGVMLYFAEVMQGLCWLMTSMQWEPWMTVGHQMFCWKPTVMSEWPFVAGRQVHLAAGVELSWLVLAQHLGHVLCPLSHLYPFLYPFQNHLPVSHPGMAVESRSPPCPPAARLVVHPWTMCCHVHSTDVLSSPSRMQTRQTSSPDIPGLDRGSDLS